VVMELAEEMELFTDEDEALLDRIWERHQE
jgi:hypothetical protein